MCLFRAHTGRVGFWTFKTRFWTLSVSKTCPKPSFTVQNCPKLSETALNCPKQVYTMINIHSMYLLLGVFPKCRPICTLKKLIELKNDQKYILFSNFKEYTMMLCSLQAYTHRYMAMNIYAISFFNIVYRHTDLD